MDRREYMNSLGVACNELKNQYDNCFNAWFSNQFLKGDTNDSKCAPLYNIYQQCIKDICKIVPENKVMEACKELKLKYDTCFNNWFSERFLKGDKSDAMCASLLKVYKECVEKAMKEQQIELQDIQADHLETDKEKTPQS